MTAVLCAAQKIVQRHGGLKAGGAPHAAFILPFDGAGSAADAEAAGKKAEIEIRFVMRKMEQADHALLVIRFPPDFRYT